VTRIAQRFFDVELRDDGVVWLQRKPVLYETLEDINVAYDTFLATVDDWALKRRMASRALGKRGQAAMAWLYDVRDTPGQRNDDAFERVIKTRRADLLRRSPFLVVLVKTAAGKMQVTRLARADKSPVHVMDDFDQALAWLTEQMKHSGLH